MRGGGRGHCGAPARLQAILRAGREPRACTSVPGWPSRPEVMSAQTVGDLAFRSLGPPWRCCWERSETMQPGPSTSHLCPGSRRELKALASEDLFVNHPPHPFHLQHRLAPYPEGLATPLPYQMLRNQHS